MMTTFQIVLAIVGVALIAVIIIYNLMQERRFRKEADKMFAHRRDDVMLGESVRGETSKRRSETRIQLTDDAAPGPEVRQALEDAEAPELDLDRGRKPPGGSILSSLEPIDSMLDDDDAVPYKVERVAPVAPEPAPVPVDVPPMPRQPAPVSPAPSPPPVLAPFHAEPEMEPETATAVPSGLDDATEYVARLKFVSPVLSNFGPLLSALRRIGKPMRAFGKRPDAVWEALSSQPRSLYEQVEFGLQLADRSGALSQDQLDAFCRALYEFAAEEGGAVSCPDKAEALRRAGDLDLFCMDVDVLIGLNVVSADSRPFTSEAMHGLALDARLELDADGVYYARDGFGHVLFSLANQGEEPFPRDGRGLTTHGITLLFDVPRVADGLAVFDRMTRLGFDLAWRLEGRLVDDNSRVVSEESLNRDRTRLAAFYQRMEARGIPAGGERALRLFV